MKQIFSLSIALFTLVLSSFANGPKISKPVLHAFKQQFAQAQEVAWTEGSEYYKASFMLQGKTVTAYYSEEGELMAITRNISSTELSKDLRSGLQQETDGRWVTELFAVSNLGATTYYAVVENADTRVVLQSRGNKKWTVYQVSQKQ